MRCVQKERFSNQSYGQHCPAYREFEKETIKCILVRVDAILNKQHLTEREICFTKKRLYYLNDS